jgi:hypothetical protein
MHTYQWLMIRTELVSAGNFHAVRMELWQKHGYDMSGFASSIATRVSRLRSTVRHCCPIFIPYRPVRQGVDGFSGLFGVQAGQKFVLKASHILLKHFH